MLHCNDVNCTAGGYTIRSPDTGGDIGQYSTLTLDASGIPVVSYYDASNQDLKVLHCSNRECASPGGILMTSGTPFPTLTGTSADTIDATAAVYYRRQRGETDASTSRNKRLCCSTITTCNIASDRGADHNIGGTTSPIILRRLYDNDPDGYVKRLRQAYTKEGANCSNATATTSPTPTDWSTPAVRARQGTSSGTA